MSVIHTEQLLRWPRQFLRPVVSGGHLLKVKDSFTGGGIRPRRPVISRQ